MGSLLRRAVVVTGVVGLLAGSGTSEAQVLIVNGSNGTSEPTTTSQITTNLVNLFGEIGVTPTVLSGIPPSLAGYTQVWDIRFNNTFALGASDQSLYLNFLQGGGGMFLMGENAGFMTRNNSILAFINQAGGGNLSFVTPSSVQTVHDPFTGPNAVSQVDYAAPGGVSSAGTGNFITSDANGYGSGVAWAKGTLANAMNGALTTIFDVNFMQNLYDLPASQNLTRNLIGFVDSQAPVDPTVVPEPISMVLLGTGLAGIGAARRRRRLEEG